MRKFYTLTLSLLFGVPLSFVAAQQAISYSPFITGLSAPVEAVNAGDGTARLFIVQQNGIIRVYDPAAGGLQTTPFLNISTLVLNNGEQGLLSMAFHPQFETNGYFFVYYNNTSGAITVARYQASGASNVANAGSAQVLLTIPKPFQNHNGGHLQFGNDGNLYFATGDGGSGNDPFNNAQDSTTLLGKMLRINVDNFTTAPYYTVPTSNPFYNTPNFDNRIWARGLRNPFRWSFDRLTGDMWIGDVGQGAKEEINFTPASSTGGENYGWRCYEGSIRTPGITACDVINYRPPVHDYDNPSSGASSVVGGYVYRGTEYPFFQGYYTAVDVYSGNAYLLKSNGTGGFSIREVTGLPNFVVGFGEAEDGTLYAVQQSTGTVYKIVPSLAVLPIKIQSFTGRQTAGGNELRWTVSSASGLSKYIVEYSMDGNRFTPVGEVAAVASSHLFVHRPALNTAAYYRLQMQEIGGGQMYSAVIRLKGEGGRHQLYPTSVREGRITIITDGALQKLQVVNSTGGVVFEKALNGVAGQLQVQLPSLARGIYYVRLMGKKTESKTIMVE